MPELEVLRVFVDADGGAGNPLGVFVHGASIPRERRQDVAAELNYSETVFLDDVDSGRFEIYTPAVELPFAGHPTVGTAWLLTRRRGAAPPAIRPPAGEIGVFQEAGMTWIRARAKWAPAMEVVQLDSAQQVEALAPDPGADYTYAWAFRDEAQGVVAARFFAPRYGVPDDPATGSAAVKLCAMLGRELRIEQRGSELFVRPAERGGWVELGGRVVADERREFAL